MGKSIYCEYTADTSSPEKAEFGKLMQLYLTQKTVRLPYGRKRLSILWIISDSSVLVFAIEEKFTTNAVILVTILAQALSCA